MDELLNDISGQNKSIKILSQLYKSNRVPHALLFTGYEGIGKHFTALQFAKLLNNGSVESGIQKKISNLQEPYIKYVMPLPRGRGETASNSGTEKLSEDTISQVNSELEKKVINPYHKITIDRAFNIKINSIREINKFINVNYDDIKYRFIIINDAHLMNDEAQNALLKNLEEPPGQIIFILITPFEENLLPTIKSRCWEINFDPLSKNDITKILVKYFSVEQKTAAKAAAFAEGSVTKAIELIENDVDYLLEKTILILRYSLAKKYHTAAEEIKELTDNGSDLQLRLILLMIAKWFTDVIKNRAKIDNVYFEEFKETILKFNKKFNDIDVTQTLTKIDSLKNKMDMNVNLNIIGMNIIFEIAAIS
jgi:DNA polymerase-3 subunit delta'